MNEPDSNYPAISTLFNCIQLPSTITRKLHDVPLQRNNSHCIDVAFSLLHHPLLLLLLFFFLPFSHLLIVLISFRLLTVNHVNHGNVAELFIQWFHAAVSSTAAQQQRAVSLWLFDLFHRLRDRPTGCNSSGKTASQTVEISTFFFSLFFFPVYS